MPDIFLICTALFLTLHGTQCHEPEWKVDLTQTDGPLAVSVARTTSESEFADPLTFNDVVVDDTSAWDPDTSSIYVPEDSVYFFHLNAGATAGERINMNLRGTASSADILRTSVTHDGTDTIGRDFISRVQAGSLVHVENTKGATLYSEGDRHTSFTAFDISAFMANDSAIFSVGRGSNFTSLGVVDMNEVYVNVGATISNVVTVPTTGIYVLSFSAGFKEATDASVILNSATKGHLTEIYRKNNAHNGADMIGKLVLAELTAGESLNISLRSGQLYCDAEHQVSFSGFQYTPRTGPPAAWSVYTNLRVNSSIAVTDPFPFEGALVNTDNIYNNVTHEVTIVHPGVYYVSLYMGVDIGLPIDAFVVRGRVRPEFNLYRSSTSHTNYDAVSQGLLLRLLAGETLRVVLDAGSYEYSDGDKQSIFSGFLLGP